MSYNVLDFGAKGDGKTNDAAAIQAAIDTCSKAGGGRVVLTLLCLFYYPEGKCRSSPGKGKLSPGTQRAGYLL